MEGKNQDTAIVEECRSINYLEGESVYALGSQQRGP